MREDTIRFISQENRLGGVIADGLHHLSARTGLFDSEIYLQWLMQAGMAPLYDYLTMQLK